MKDVAGTKWGNGNRDFYLSVSAWYMASSDGLECTGVFYFGSLTFLGI